MPNASHRGQTLTASPIRSLLPFARRAIAGGKNILHLNIGQPDIATPPQALDLVRNLKNDIVRYGPSEGLTELRKTVATYYDKFDADLDWTEVMVTTGASEAILYALLACCDRDSEVIIPEPFYANYLGFAHLTDVRITAISSHIESGFSLPSPEEFEQKITPRTKAIFLCNPGNPTGQLYQAAELKRLMKIVEKHKLFLIVDEVYREFCYDDIFTSVLSFPEMSDHVIVVDSISKVFSACGARVGYLISKNKEILDVVNKFAQLRLCPPYFGQQLALGCYQSGQEYIDRAKQAYDNRRHVLYNRLIKIDGVQTYFPAAAFYNVVALPVQDAEDFCRWMLTDFELNGHTVMLAPAHGFYSNQALGKSQVRIAYVLNEEKLELAMDCLDAGLMQYRDMFESKYSKTISHNLSV